MLRRKLYNKNRVCCIYFKMIKKFLFDVNATLKYFFLNVIMQKECNLKICIYNITIIMAVVLAVNWNRFGK